MNPNEFSTQDYSLANWLLFNRVDFLGVIEFPGETRKSFVFVGGRDVNDLVADWQHPQSDEAAICKQFFKAHSQIKKALKESLNVATVARPGNNN